MYSGTSQFKVIATKIKYPAYICVVYLEIKKFLIMTKLLLK